MLPALADPQDWAFRNKIAYRSPADWVLLGVFGEGSGWSKDELYIHTLVMPLYVPNEVLDLSYSRRVRPAGTFALGDVDGFRAAVAEAVSVLPTQEQALQRFAHEPSEASAGAQVLLRAASAGEKQLAQVRAVRDATAAALGIAS